MSQINHFLNIFFNGCFVVSFSCVLIIQLLFDTGTSTPGFGAKDQGLWCWTRAAKKNTAHQAVQPHTWTGIVWLLVGGFQCGGKGTPPPPPPPHTHTQLINACTNRLYPLLPLLHCILCHYCTEVVVTLALGALSLFLSLSLSLSLSLPSLCHCFCLSAHLSITV